MTAPTVGGVFVARGQAVHAAPIVDGVATAPLCGQRGRRYRTGGAITCRKCIALTPREDTP